MFAETATFRLSRGVKNAIESKIYQQFIRIGARSERHPWPNSSELQDTEDFLRERGIIKNNFSFSA